MLNTIRHDIRDYDLIRPGDKVIVALSGGPDSMALLHILKRLGLEAGFEIVAAHINHGLRSEAEPEQQFVEEQCQSLHIPCYTAVIDVRDLARQAKTSLEDAGRQARYGFLNTLLKDLGAQSIATAHHQDDQAETVLLHLLRGAGLQGLRGIMPRNGNLIRPLLQLSKAVLLSYLHEHKIDFCLDQSNQDQSFVRNRIRHQLIPLLQEDYNPRIVDNLNRLADIIRAENELIEEFMEKYWLQLVIEQDAHRLAIDYHGLASLPLAAQRRIVLRALSAAGGAAGWEGRDVEKVLELLKKMGSAKVLQFKKGVMINKSYDRIIFTNDWQKPVTFKIDIRIPGQTEVPGGINYQFFLKDAGGVRPTAEEVCLDYDKLNLPLVIRSREAGDLVQPAGFVGHKKLKKYFNEQKVPFWERAQVAVLASQGGEIYAVLGYCTCQPAVVSLQSKNILLIKKAGIENNMHSLKSR